MANQSSINNFLSQDQIKELTLYILDSYGTDLSFKELNESIYLVMENITGLEIESTQIIQSLISQIRNQYYDEIKCKK